MNKTRLVALSYIIIFCILPLKAFAVSFEETWEKSVSAMQRGLGAYGKKSWLDKIGTSDFDKIVHETCGILSNSDYKEQIDLVAKRKKQINELENEVHNLRLASKSAPNEPGGLWDKSLEKVGRCKSKECIEQKINKNKSLIEQYKKEIEGIKEKFYADTRKNGIKISKEQLDSLFISIDGDDLITIIGLTENIKSILLEIEKLTQEDTENIKMLQTYAGFYMMLNEAYSHSHQVLIDKINDEYLKKLEKVISTAHKEIKEANSAYLASTLQQREQLLRNITANQRTVDVGNKYRSYLKNQVAYLKASKAKIDHEIKIAANTYKTIKNSVELITLIKAAESDLNKVFAFEIPEIEVLHDEILRREFDSITAKIQNS